MPSAYPSPYLQPQPHSSSHLRASSAQDRALLENSSCHVTDRATEKLRSSWLHGKHLFEHMLSVFKC